MAADRTWRTLLAILRDIDAELHYIITKKLMRRALLIGFAQSICVDISSIRTL